MEIINRLLWLSGRANDPRFASRFHLHSKKVPDLHRATREAKPISPVIFLEKLYPKLRLGVGKGESSLQKGVCSKQLPNSLMQWAVGSGTVRVGLQMWLRLLSLGRSRNHWTVASYLCKVYSMLLEPDTNILPKRTELLKFPMCGTWLRSLFGNGRG